MDYCILLKEQILYRFYTLERVLGTERKVWMGVKLIYEDRRLILIHFIALSGSLPPPPHPVLLSVLSPPPSFSPPSLFIDDPISLKTGEEEEKERETK